MMFYIAHGQIMPEHLRPYLHDVKYAIDTIHWRVLMDCYERHPEPITSFFPAYYEKLAEYNETDEFYPHQLDVFRRLLPLLYRLYGNDVMTEFKTIYHHLHISEFSSPFNVHFTRDYSNIAQFNQLSAEEQSQYFSFLRNEVSAQHNDYRFNISRMDHALTHFNIKDPLSYLRGFIENQRLISEIQLLQLMSSPATEDTMFLSVLYAFYCMHQHENVLNYHDFSYQDVFYALIDTPVHLDDMLSDVYHQCYPEGTLPVFLYNKKMKDVTSEDIYDIIDMCKNTSYSDNIELITNY